MLSPLPGSVVLRNSEFFIGFHPVKLAVNEMDLFLIGFSYYQVIQNGKEIAGIGRLVTISSFRLLTTSCNNDDTDNDKGDGDGGSKGGNSGDGSKGGSSDDRDSDGKGLTRVRWR
jgi:hypothetical protein